MADIEIRRAHAFGIKAARAGADRMAEHLGQRFGLRARWEGDVLHFERPGVTGALAITAKELHLTVTLGFLLSAMRGTIESAIVRELDEIFSKSKKDSPPKKKGG